MDGAGWVAEIARWAAPSFRFCAQTFQTTISTTAKLNKFIALWLLYLL